jgi:hypothetical protein
MKRIIGAFVFMFAFVSMAFAATPEEIIRGRCRKEENTGPSMEHRIYRSLRTLNEELPPTKYQSVEWTDPNGTVLLFSIVSVIYPCKGSVKVWGVSYGNYQNITPFDSLAKMAGDSEFRIDTAIDDWNYALCYYQNTVVNLRTRCNSREKHPEKFMLI